MGSDQSFVEYILDQLENVGDITAKKMFGEYGIYADDKFFGLVCDNKLYIKPTEAGRAFIGNPTEALPYPGGNPSFLIEEKVADRNWLSELVQLTVAELPEPKPKRKGNGKRKRKTQ